MLTCEQVERMMKGPENPECDCTACSITTDAKALLREGVIRPLEEKYRAKLEQMAGDRFTSVWAFVICIAAGRLLVQGCPEEAVIDMANHGLDQAEEQNPMLLAVGRVGGTVQ